MALVKYTQFIESNFITTALNILENIICSTFVADNLSNIGGDEEWSRAKHILAVEGMPSDSYLDFACSISITRNDSPGNTYSKTFDADDGLRIQIFP